MPVSEPASLSADVIVIGAGVTGLAAAASLHAARVHVLVLEGRPRLGGRIFTHRVQGFALPIELGAVFVHGRVPETLGIVDAAGLLLNEVAGERWRAEGGRLHVSDDTDARVAHVMARLDATRTPDRSFSAFLDSLRGDAALGGALWRARQYVEGFDAADPDRVGERWLALAEAAARADDGDRTFRVSEGYDQVPVAIARPLPPGTIRLSTVVREVEWARSGVAVRADGLMATARAVIVTVPLSVLVAPVDGTPGPITFRPALGPEAQHALAGVAMGSALHVTVRFREPFWETLHPVDAGPHPRGLSFLSTADPDFPIWWTSYPTRAPVLTAWVGGPRAVAMSEHTHEELGGRALAALARQLKLGRRRVEVLVADMWYHDWQHDPLSRGAYSYGVVGGVDAPRTLNRPLDDALFLAGEATDPDGRSGTVHGAIASGRRAARSLLATLRV
jgi:monoamine oxidase